MGSFFVGRCPSCGQGPVMETWFVAHETCPRCGARYERGEGTWIGSTMASYAIVATLGVGGGLFLITTDNWTNGRFFALLAISAVLCALVFPLSKITWIAILHGMGHVYPDPPPREPPPIG